MVHSHGLQLSRSGDLVSDRFKTTRWSLVLSAGLEGESARQALEWLCQTYWYPLYAYVRRQGYDADSARDLTQSYFVSIFERNDLRQLDPGLGKFRSFLLASMKNFLSNQRARDEALKRRTDDPSFRIDLDNAERLYGLEASSDLDPEALFESRWARSVLDRALRRLKEEHEAAGKGELFRHLSGHLTGDDLSYERATEDLGIAHGAIRVAVHRLRKRLGALLRQEVAQTVSETEDVDAELRSLLQAASRGA